jgi:hypothetical protein
MSGLCLMIAGTVLLGCGDARTYTLYRNSVVLENARIHVATFDAAADERYNSGNCQTASDLFPAAAGDRDKILVRERKISPVAERSGSEAARHRAAS